MPRQTDIPDPIRSALRRVGGVLGIVLMVLQLLAPQLAQAGEGAWIEICSEEGAVWIQMPVEGTDDPCPDCGDCLMCSTGVDFMTPAYGGVVEPVLLDARQPTRTDVSARAVRNRLWPETRGPPIQDKRGAMC